MARSGTDFVAGAALSQGEVQTSWQARHFLTSGTDATQIPLARTRKAAHADFVAGAVFSQGQVQISWQGQHFRKVKHRFRGRGSILAGSSTFFVAGAAFSQGQVQISWQAQQFRKVRCRFRGRRNTFVIEGTITFFQLQLEKSQKLSTKVVCEVHFSSCSSKNRKVKYKSSFRSKYFDEAS